MIGRLDVLYRLMLDSNVAPMIGPESSQAYRGESSDFYSQEYDVPMQLEAGAWAPAAIAGISWDVLPELTVAASVQTSSLFEAEGEFDVDFEGSAITPDLAVLSDNTIRVEIVQPWIIRLGTKWSYLQDTVSLFDLALDVVYETWSQNEELRIEVPGGFGDPTAPSFTPIGAISIPKRWEDTVSVRFGSQVYATSWWTGRFGAFVESGAVPEDTSNVDTISYNRLGLALGSTFHTPFGLDVAIGYEHIFQATREVTVSDVRTVIPLSQCADPYDATTSCPEPGEPPGQGITQGTYETGMDLVSVGLIYAY